MISSLKSLFQRDLDRISIELEQFSSEKAIWSSSDEFPNSAGHLTAHICGNLRHFIGHVLGGSEYIRNRSEEFLQESISLMELNKLLELTKTEITLALDKLTAQDLQKNFPQNVFGHEMTTEYFLLHLSGHLNYHLGQINYLRKSI